MKSVKSLCVRYVLKGLYPDFNPGFSIRTQGLEKQTNAPMARKHAAQAKLSWEAVVSRRPCRCYMSVAMGFSPTSLKLTCDV
ncbi:hypothetical protein [Marinicella marina]|uniref:hypothetical protein n=1 Tax=Marinicella marina TaxID=2996016 RepID=UPI002260B88B|nr:hypothetical protein [Marinicella marina]